MKNPVKLFFKKMFNNQHAPGFTGDVGGSVPKIKIEKKSMKINNSLIETLLFGEEGVDLDFKRDQYKFLKATENEKGELLKDIIAFANSWQ